MLNGNCSSSPFKYLKIQSSMTIHQNEQQAIFRCLNEIDF